METEYPTNPSITWSQAVEKAKAPLEARRTKFKAAEASIASAGAAAGPASAESCAVTPGRRRTNPGPYTPGGRTRRRGKISFSVAAGKHLKETKLRSIGRCSTLTQEQIIQQLAKMDAKEAAAKRLAAQKADLERDLAEEMTKSDRTA